MSTHTNLVPWQHRVVVEATLLEDKLRKLYDFLQTDLFKGIDDKEQGRLTRQAGLMRSLHQTLEERIASFTDQTSGTDCKIKGTTITHAFVDDLIHDDNILCARAELLEILTKGIAPAIAAEPWNASKFAEGVMTALNILAPLPKEPVLSSLGSK